MKKAVMIGATVVALIGAVSVGYMMGRGKDTGHVADSSDKRASGVSQAEQANDDALFDMAMKKVNAKGLYASDETARCLSFMYEGSDKDYVYIVVRENHNPERNCGGDPDVSPMRDSLKVSRKDSKIYAGVGEEILVDSCYVMQHQLGYSQFKQVSYKSASVVTKNGRSHFYSAPADNCKNEKVFIVDGDVFEPKYEYKGFTYGNYINPKSKKETSGWVSSDTLIQAS